MRYLLYGIFRGQEQQKAIPTGVDGQPVFLVGKKGLRAAISRVPHAKFTADIPRLVAYQKVVESLHRDPTVAGIIPMRYGCLFDERAQIIELLEERCCQYEGLLDELEGCVEMGIRILISEPVISARPAPGGRTNPQATGPGQTFLATRKAHYARQEMFANEVDLVSQRCLAALGGLFVKSKAEDHPKAATPSAFLSLYFLVPGNSVERFRQRFRDLCEKEPAKLLLSGPWPPYNFVLPEAGPVSGDV